MPYASCMSCGTNFLSALDRGHRGLVPRLARSHAVLELARLCAMLSPRLTIFGTMRSCLPPGRQYPLNSEYTTMKRTKPIHHDYTRKVQRVRKTNDLGRCLLA